MLCAQAGDVPAVEQVTFVFAHGLGGSLRDGLFHARRNIICEPMHSFNFQHAIRGNEFVSFGQELEIETLKTECDSILGNKVLVGLSMGASSIITYLSDHYSPDIKAAVLISPFDSLESVIAFKTYSIPGVYNVAKKFINSSFMYPHYDDHGIKPIKVVHKLNKNMPILFIHSKADELVPVTCSRHMYRHLKRAGHNDVYLLELDTATHAGHCYGPDAQVVEKVVHAFYKKYNLPHNPELAQDGDALFNQCQPTIKEVAQRK
jgi:pimeloyl-ACP methyl ester carboxylesterase